MSIRVLEVIPDVADGTSWYRGRLPNSLIEKQTDGDITFIPVNHSVELRWSELVKCNMVFMQRPTTDQAVNTMINARRLGVPVWIDYDDLLVALPDDNIHKGAFDSAYKNIVLLLDNATVVSCSTNFLKDELSKVGGQSYRVIPNAWYDKLGYARAHSPKGGIFWRGSNHHQKDLYECKDVFRELTQKGVKINMIGHKPWFYDFDVKLYEYGTLLEYFTRISSGQFGKICVVPLADNPFNRSKSNNGWMEASYAGAMTIAPDFDEWHRPGVLNYKSESHLLGLILEMLANTEKTMVLWKDSVEYIKENLDILKINGMRIDLIREICK